MIFVEVLKIWLDPECGIEPNEVVIPLSQMLEDPSSVTKFAALRIVHR